jgi:hypothetical protein
MNEEIMLKLKPFFQKEIFSKIIKKYNGSINASKYLQIPASSIRGYKNLYSNTVPKTLIKSIINLGIINQSELNKNLILVTKKQDIINNSLDFGREKRNKNLLRLKKEIPLLKEVMHSNELNVKLWLNKHLLLANTGFRKVSYKEKENYIILKYKNFARDGFKDFKVRIPKAFKLNNEFLYFLGLWCGDRAGGKRFGICNQNRKIIEFTKEFLIKNYQEVEKILYLSKKIEEPKVRYDKKFYLDKEKGWVLSVHSTNGFLSSFFHYLLLNLEEFLSLIKNRCPFFAGLFDAEGNVSLYNKSFRWACKNEELIKIYSKFLGNMGLYKRYDGGCLVSYNKKDFYNKIFPYLKHSKKIELSFFLCTGKGKLPENIKIIFNYIKKNPHKTAKEIAKALKKSKVYSELSLLNKFKFISSEGYPLKFKINKEMKNISGD